jgi:hypothetical protein
MRNAGFGIFLGLALFVTGLQLEAAPAPTPGVPATGAPAPGTRTNAFRPPQRTPGKTNVIGKAQSRGTTTNAVPATQRFLNSIRTEPAAAFNRLKASKAFYPVIIGLPLCLAAAIFFLFKSFKAKSASALTKAVEMPAPSLAARPAKKPQKVHSCNVLQVAAEARHLWQFGAQNGGFALSRHQTSSPGEALPKYMVAKSWRALFQRKLNIAWLPSEQVFLRVAHLPRSDFNETLAMVELQLEKLSPMPVTQIVWSIHVLPHAQESLQTVIVLIVARDVVEEFLGKLEGHGYLADRLELPLLDQLQATAITEEGAWIYPQARSGQNSALVAWWYDGVLQNLDLVTLPTAPHSPSLKEQLLQMAWAGEMDGWLKSPPHWHLVADPASAGQWEPALREALEQPVALAPPLPGAELAALTARRAAHSDPRASLLPPEYSARYQQQFVDRLWMRGLTAVLGLYLLGLAVYGVALGFATFRTRGVESRVTALGTQYTNSIQIKQRYQVLKDRQELKFAALECWNAVARYQPDSVVLDQMNFVDGKRLTLNGTASAEQRKDLYDFEGQLRKATLTNGEALFDPNKGDHVQYSVQGGTVRWNFSLELKRAEVE